MTIEFDPGYCQEPWRTLCGDYPSTDVYPAADFRTEWGPIFHRGRLDGTARVLLVGQDPAQHEAVTRRVLVGEAGQRTQGFLAKLGITQSYVMVNTYLYSVYGQSAANHYRSDPDIAAYRHSWLNELTAHNHLEAIIALGSLADHSYQLWLTQASTTATTIPYQHITHPTAPESGSRSGQGTHSDLTKAMLENWNTGLRTLHPHVHHPDTPTQLVLYGDAFAPGDDVEIPAADLPAGLPTWMRSLDNWADRTGTTTNTKRATITITVPQDQRPW